MIRDARPASHHTHHDVATALGMAPLRTASLSTSLGGLVHRHSTVRSIQHHHSNTSCPTPRSSLTTVLSPTTITTQGTVAPTSTSLRGNATGRHARARTTERPHTPHWGHRCDHCDAPGRTDRKQPSLPERTTVHPPLGDGTPYSHGALARYCVPVHHPISCRVDPCRRLERSLRTPA